jgi:hypothetical protein
MKPVTARHRTDTTAKALTAYAKSLHVGVQELGGVIDVALFYGTRVVRLVDFKSDGGKLTDSQSKLVAKGVPVHFIRDPHQLDALVAEMKAEAHR